MLESLTMYKVHMYLKTLLLVPNTSIWAVCHECDANKIVACVSNLNVLRI